jgi:hypothetical protein
MQPRQHRNICKSCFQARTSKRCRKCGKYKLLTREFWQPEAAAADGFRNDCLDCRAARDAAKYEAKKSDPLYRERKAKNARSWYRNNLEYARRRQKKYTAKPEVKQRRREREAERRATDSEFVEQNKRRSSDWYKAIQGPYFRRTPDAPRGSALGQWRRAQTPHQQSRFKICN